MESCNQANISEKTGFLDYHSKMMNRDKEEIAPDGDEVTTNGTAQLEEEGLTAKGVKPLHHKAIHYIETHRVCACKLCTLVAFILYFAFAMSPKYGRPPFSSSNGNYVLFALTMLAAVYVVVKFCYRRINKTFNVSKMTKQLLTTKTKLGKGLAVIFHLGMLATFIAVIARTTYSYHVSTNVAAVCGLLIWIICALLLSKSPKLVRWQYVLHGFEIQLIFGLLVMRTRFGFSLMEFLSGVFVRFFNFSKVGAKFVFGELTTYNTFVLNVVPVIVFIASSVYFLFHVGWVQAVVGECAILYSVILDVSAAESAFALANIFLSFTEAIFIFGPFLTSITDNELCTMAIVGLASVSGTTIPLYLDFGAKAIHVFTSCMITSACSLIFGKIVYPSAGQYDVALSRTQIKQIRTKTHKNALDAIMAGSKTGMAVSAAVVGSLLAVISMLGLMDALTEWIFAMVNVSNMNFQRLLSYPFWPMAFLMGIDRKDCAAAGQLLGIKVIINELVAYQKMGEMINIRNDHISNRTLTDLYCGLSPVKASQPFLMQEKSIVIMTYALCGFGNIGTITLQIATIGVLDPPRTGLLSGNSLRFLGAAMLSNSFAAGLAGLILGSKSLNYTITC